VVDMNLETATSPSATARPDRSASEGFELGLYLGAGLAALGVVVALLAIGGRHDPKTRPADAALRAQAAQGGARLG
jgi:hypothetical protein